MNVEAKEKEEGGGRQGKNERKNERINEMIW